MKFYAGESVITCTYCGSSYIYEGSDSEVIKVKDHYLVTNKLTENELSDILLSNIMSTRLAPVDIEDITIIEFKGRYLPYWIINGKATTVFTGSKIHHKREKSSGDDDSYKTIKEYIPYDGNFSKSHFWPVYGRHIDEFNGLEALKPGNISVEPCWQSYPFAFFGKKLSKTSDHGAMRIPFDINLIDSDIDIVNAQINKDSAVQEARQEVELYSWQKAKEEVSVLQQCNTNFKLQEASFVHIPFWWVKYEYKNRVFTALIHGHNKELVYLSYPIANEIKFYVSLTLNIITTVILLFVLSGYTLILVLALLWIALLIHGLYLLNDTDTETDKPTNSSTDDTDTETDTLTDEIEKDEKDKIDDDE